MKINYFVNNIKQDIKITNDEFLNKVKEKFYTNFIWISYYTENYFVISKLADYHNGEYTISAPVGNPDMMKTTLIIVKKDEKHKIDKLKKFIKNNCILHNEINYTEPMKSDFGNVYSLSQYHSYIWGNRTPFINEFIYENRPKLKVISKDLTFLSNSFTDIINHCGISTDSQNAKSIAITNLFSLFWFRLEKNLKILVNEDVNRQHPTETLIKHYAKNLWDVESIKMFNDFDIEEISLNSIDFEKSLRKLFELMGDVKHDFNFEYKTITLKDLLSVVLTYIISIYSLYSNYGIDFIKTFMDKFNISISFKSLDIKNGTETIEHVIENSFLHKDESITYLLKEFDGNVFELDSRVFWNKKRGI